MAWLLLLLVLVFPPLMLAQILGAFGGLGLVLMGRFPLVQPVLDRIVLRSAPGSEEFEAGRDGDPAAAEYHSLRLLIGETGQTTTVLRPSGNARFGELVVDVTAEGCYVEPDRLVRVIDVQGRRVVVKPVAAGKLYFVQQDD